MTETFTAVDGYDRHKPRHTLTVRRMTLEEIKQLSGHAHALGNDGTVIRVKINGAVKTWKTRPNEVSVPIKYGLYEYARFETAEALNRFVVVVS